jgi:hypothetical protein
MLDEPGVQVLLEQVPKMAATVAAGVGVHPMLPVRRRDTSSSASDVRLVNILLVLNCSRNVKLCSLSPTGSPPPHVRAVPAAPVYSRRSSTPYRPLRKARPRRQLRRQARHGGTMPRPGRQLVWTRRGQRLPWRLRLHLAVRAGRLRHHSSRHIRPCRPGESRVSGPPPARPQDACWLSTLPKTCRWTDQL